MFRSVGYATGYVGKWHLGTRMTTLDGKVQGADNTDFTKPIRSDRLILASMIVFFFRVRWTCFPMHLSVASNGKVV